MLLYRTRITGTLREDQCGFMTKSRSVLHRMRNVSVRSCREKHTFYVQCFFFSENVGVIEIMRKNIVELGRPWMTI